MTGQSVAHGDDPHAADEMVGPHAQPHAQPTDHGGDHGHDDQGHASESLGPIDRRAWGAGILGIALGLAVALAFLAGGG